MFCNQKTFSDASVKLLGISTMRNQLVPIGKWFIILLRSMKNLSVDDTRI